MVPVVQKVSNRWMFSSVAVKIEGPKSRDIQVLCNTIRNTAVLISFGGGTL